MQENKTNKNKYSKFKIFFIIISIILIILIIGLLIIYNFINSKLNKINYEEIDESQIEINEEIKKEIKDEIKDEVKDEVKDEIKDKLFGYRNIVLFGIDDADGYTGRSDCIILFSINQTNKNVKMTSIYRDTYVEVPRYGYTKINHAFSYGGATLAMSTINRNLDLDITEYVSINFQVVKEVVDSVGGVEINVTKKEATQIPRISKEGTYNLDGEQALAYGRIRKIDTDYQRTERMRTVIAKVFSKVKKMSPIEMNKIADDILPKLHTNIKKSEITTITKDVTKYNIGQSIGWPYEVNGKMINGVWYGIPKTLQTSVQKLHEDLFEDTNYKTSEVVNGISNTIIQKTGVK